MTRIFQLSIILLLVIHIQAFLSRRPANDPVTKVPYTTLSAKTSTIDFDVLENKRILVVGGSGRVGGSVVTQLLKRGAKVTVGGTRAESYYASKLRWLELFPSIDTARIEFTKVDRESRDSISSVLKSKEFDLVVHTAGPFQGKVARPNGVIDASVANGVPYVDVCDDYCTASAAKTKYQKKAQDSQVPCIISTGCWVSFAYFLCKFAFQNDPYPCNNVLHHFQQPGVSSLMAKQLTKKVLKSDKSLRPEDVTVDFGFFTAGTWLLAVDASIFTFNPDSIHCIFFLFITLGSGGAGSTLLVATFLILAEEALTIIDGRRKPVKAMKEYSLVNFGPIVGEKPIAHLNLLETASV